MKWFLLAINGLLWLGILAYACRLIPPLAKYWRPWLLAVLASLRELILSLENQLALLDAQLKERVQDQPLPKGLGQISLVTLDAEICDWHRFNNRKQIGSYTGCCPGEHSSAGNKAWP